jgi:NADH dehydrogenase [ubiquinone] 1 alpha subcomplex assembly factor 5
VTNDHPVLVFDRHAVRHHRDRAARAQDESKDCGFLHREIAERMTERLADTRRSFDRALLLGGRQGELPTALANTGFSGWCALSDISHSMVAELAGSTFVADEEHLPVADASFDLVLSNLTLHWTNDLPGALIQIRQTLRSDGMMLATLFGGETLHELRSAFLEAELEILGGVTPHVAPMTDIRDAGGLLQRAGFTLPIVDTDRITIDYEDPFRLMLDLRLMGEASALAGQRKSLRRDVLTLTCQRYLAAYGGGRVPATFDILTLSGWAPPRP